MKIETENVKCDLCNEDDYSVLFTETDREFGIDGEFTIVQCNNCELIYLNPRPLQSELGKFYPESSFFYKDPFAAGKLLYTLKQTLKKLLASASCIFRFLPDMFLESIGLVSVYSGHLKYKYLDGFRNLSAKKRSFLDIGCGSGFSVYPYGLDGSLYYLKKKGWDVHGVEMNSTACSIANKAGLNVFYGTLNEAAFENDKFDVVRICHVLEHVPSPTETLTEIKGILKKGGWVILTVPNIDSISYRAFGKYWAGLNVPRHFYFFTPKTLRQYFQKVGLEELALYFDATSVDFLHSLNHFLADHIKKPGTRSLPCKEKDIIIESIGESRFRSLCQILQPLMDRINQAQLGENITFILTK